MNRWQRFLASCRDSDSDSDSSIGLMKEIPQVRATNSEFLMDLEEAAKIETTCRFPECEKVLSDPDIKCEHCDWGYCGEHALPEMHGCDELINFDLEDNGEIVESEDYDPDSRYSFNQKLFDILCAHRLNVSDEEQSEPREDEPVQTQQESVVSEKGDYIVSEEDESVLSEEDESVQTEQESVVSEKGDYIVLEEDESVVSEEDESVVSEEDESVVSEEDESVVSEEAESFVSEEEQSIMSEENQSVVSEEECEAVANKLSSYKLERMHFETKAKPGPAKAKP